MALDNAQFISELSITDPPGTDELSEGDDQIRTTKRATFQSFPFVDAQVDRTAAELNDVALKSAAQTISGIWTHSATIELENNISLSAKESGGTLRSLLLISAANSVIFGGVSNNTELRAFASHSMQIGGVEVAEFLGLTGGGLLVKDIGGTKRKAGFRNPAQFSSGVTRSLLQTWEGAVISWTGGALTTDILEQGTCITLVNASAGGLNLLQGTASITVVLGGSRLTGTRIIAVDSVVQIYYGVDNAVTIWGNGIT